MTLFIGLLVSALLLVGLLGIIAVVGQLEREQDHNG
jgi:hypothetical protein